MEIGTVLFQALNFIQRNLNQYLVNQMQLESEVVVLNGLADLDGQFPPKNQNKVVLTLINLEHETAKQYYGGQTNYGEQVASLKPAVRFNLDILLSACFDDYEESLKFLSLTAQYFQTNPAFNRQQFPRLPENIDALHLELENSPYSQTHNLWTALGAKYQPSLIYKVRHLAIQSGDITGTTNRVANIHTEASS